MKGLVKGLMNAIILVAVLGVFGVWVSPSLKSAILSNETDSALLKLAYIDKASNVPLEIEGRVILVMPDLEDQGRFQEFRIQLENGHTVRVQHDLDEAGRVPVTLDTVVRIRGEYDWSFDGGLMHWTHDDPAGVRDGGWIEVKGKRYL